MMLFVIGCGQETVFVPDSTRPTVIAVTPAQGATGVAVSSPLTATFSKAMASASISGTTFRVAGPGGVAVAGAVSYTAGTNTATFIPSANLATSTTYTATITSGVTDTASPANSLLADYVWTFTTAATIAPVSPVVTLTSPLNGAANVPTGSSLSATFSTAMNPATINATTFRVAAPGGVAVAGTVGYAGLSATFTPSAALATSTTYVATITTGAQSTAGAPLTGNYTWSFTTAATPTPPVAPTVLTTVPANGAANVATGATLAATFSTTMNPTTINTTTFRLAAPGGAAVAGTVGYAGVIATFTPSAALATNTTYVATITTGAQSTAGAALANNYTWSFTTAAAATPPVAPTVLSTVPANNAAGVPVAQVLSATFSTAMNAATINNTTFLLTAPGGTSVSGAVSYSGIVASFTPTAALAVNTTYVATITTGAQNVAGTALASNYAWTFTTVAGAVPPVVVSTVPVNNATGVPLTQTLSAVFSKPMNAATLTATTFTVTGPSGVAVAGTVAYASGTNTATFAPSAALLPSATYVATITTGAQDTTGTALGGNYVWSFRTVPAPTPPTIISTSPANKAAGVPFNQQVTATFSEAMNSATIDETTFTVTAPGGVAVAGTVTYVATGSTATFAPTAALAASTTYVGTITTGAKDLLGVALVNNYTWTFTTGAAPDTTKPTVISTIPANGATNVPFNQAISAVFSEAMDPTKFTATTFTVTGPGITPVAGLVTYAAVGNTATFTPTAALTPGTLFTATITTGVTDLAGNTLAANYVWTFTTGAAPDTTAPTVTLTNPANGATAVPLSQAISATFSEAMDPLTITTATFTVATGGGTNVAGTVAYNAVTFIATLTPSAPLTAGTSYVATVTTGAKDLAGNSLAAGTLANPWNFSTSAVVVVPPVNLGTASLFGGFGGGAGMTNDGTLTVINGNIGTTGVSTLITGFHDNTPNCIYTETPLNVGLVNGSIVTSAPPPTVGCPNEGTAITAAVAAQAALDAKTAYDALVAFPNGLDVSVCAGCGGGSAGELGNRTLAPGIYASAPGSYGITQGDLTLDAKGDPNAFWVFQMSTTFTVGTPQTPRSVLLVNGAQAKNVFWQVGTAATINGIVGGGTLSGTVISQSGVSVSTAGVAAVTTINGRALVLTGPVTLVNTVINVPAP
ncbi:Ig-like domain-containing protein [Terriglobus roseus]|nr:Ig-like domain-containing protein [Terriglobus roseus]